MCIYIYICCSDVAIDDMEITKDIEKSASEIVV